MLKTELITRESDFIALGKEWNSLLQGSDANNVFLTWEWISNWWENFGGEKTLCVLAVIRDEGLVGLVPLYLRQRLFYGMVPIRELLFLGTGETVRSEYLDIIARPRDYDAVTREVFSFLQDWSGWDLAYLKDILPSSSLLRLMDHPKLIGGTEVRQESDDCYYVQLPDSYEKYLSGLDRKMRRNIRNRRRKLEHNFDTNFSVPRDREEIDQWWEAFTTLHQDRMSRKGLEGKFGDKRYLNFHRKLIADLAGSGKLFLSLLKCDGQPVAARYGFLLKGKIYDYQTGFDPAFGQQGVMQALVSYVIEEAISQGNREFDFLAGGEKYKRRFSNRIRRIQSLTIFNRTMAGQLSRILNKIRYFQKNIRWPKNPGQIILSPFYRKDIYRMHQLDLSPSPPLPRVIPEGEIREITDPDDPILKIAGRLKGLNSAEPFIRRIKRGEKCYVFSSGGRAVSFIWINREKWHQDRFGPHRLPPATAFLYDCITSPAWRGLSIYPFLILNAGKYLYAEGDRTLLTLVNRENSSAIRSMEKAGFLPRKKKVVRIRELGRSEPFFKIQE